MNRYVKLMVEGDADKLIPQLEQQDISYVLHDNVVTFVLYAKVQEAIALDDLKLVEVDITESIHESNNVEVGDRLLFEPKYSDPVYLPCIPYSINGLKVFEINKNNYKDFKIVVREIKDDDIKLDVEYEGIRTFVTLPHLKVTILDSIIIHNLDKE